MVGEKGQGAREEGAFYRGGRGIAHVISAWYSRKSLGSLPGPDLVPEFPQDAQDSGLQPGTPALSPILALGRKSASPGPLTSCHAITYLVIHSVRENGIVLKMIQPLIQS